MNSVTLEGKKGLVVGIANADSLAYGCAKVFRDWGPSWRSPIVARKQSLTSSPGGRTGVPDHHALRRS